MTDTIIKGTGNSRLLKSVPNLRSLAPTYDALIDLLIGSGLPVDVSTLIAAGVQIFGTGYSKAEVLPDSLCAALGLAAAATPAQALEKLRIMAAGAQSTADGRLRFVTGSYTGNGTWGKSNPTTVTLPFRPQIFICHIGVSPACAGQYGGWGSSYGFITFGSVNSIYVSKNAITDGLIQHVTDNSISWYTNSSDYTYGTELQFNQSGTIYYYTAIG